MRRTVFVGCGIMGLVAAVAGAQTLSGPITLADRGPAFIYVPPRGGLPVDARSAAVFQHRVSLALVNTPVRDALTEITRQSGLRFVYDLDAIPEAARVTIHAENIRVSAALTEVLGDVDLDVRLETSDQATLVRRSASLPLRLRQQSGSIVGRVTDAKTGAAIAYATVLLEGTKYGATTSDSGTYRIANAPPGTYSVIGRILGYVAGRKSVTVSGDQTTTVDLALEKSPNQLQQVVTTGTVTPTEVQAVPTPITVISDSEIAQQQPHTINELFRQFVPTGVSWDAPNAPYSTFLSARGAADLTATAMKVIINGVETASAGLSAIDPTSIDRIEVVRGPEAAAIYGSGAFDGVVEIFTKHGSGTQGGPSVDAQAAAANVQTPYPGFRGVARQNYSANVRQASGDASYTFGGSYSHTDNFEPQHENSAMSVPSGFGAVHYASGVTSLDLSARYFVNFAPEDFNPVLFAYGLTPVYYSNQYTNTTVGGTLTVTPVSWWRSAFIAGLDQNNQDGAQRRGTPDYSTLNSTASKTTLAFHTSITGHLSSAVSGTLTAGADHWTEPVNTTGAYESFNTTGTIQEDSQVPVFVSRTTSWNNGGFVQAQVGILNALYLTAGLRADWNSDWGDSIGTALSPRVGASFTHSFGFVTAKLRGSWGSALLPPSPTDKEAESSPGYIKLANPSLGPEHNRGGDAGLDLFFGSRGSFGATYYNQRAVNLIQQVALPALGPFTNENENVGTIQNYGVELEGTYSIWRLSIRGVYGYSVSHVAVLAPGYTGDLRVGDQMLDVPKNTGGVTFATVLWPGSHVSAGLTYVGNWRDYNFIFELRCGAGLVPCPSDLSTIGTRAFIGNYPSLVKANVSVTQRITRVLSAFVSADNIGDNESYEQNDISPAFGRITTVGLRLNY